jgi:hypothetical protein
MNALARTATTTFTPAVLRLGKMNTSRTFAHEAVGDYTVMRFANEHVNGRTVMKRTHHEATGGTRRNRVTVKTSRTLLMAQPSEAPSRALSVARYHHEATGRTTLKLFIPAEHEGATACNHEATGRTARL